MVYATVAAGADRGRDYHILGVPDRLHCQPGAGVACMGLQRNAGNVLGQICLPYSLLWILVAVAAIILDDWLRYLIFAEERPQLLPVAAQRGIKTNVCGCKYNHYGREPAGSNRGHFSVVFAVYRWYLRQNRQDTEIEKLKSEQCLLTYGILACLKGLKEQGCNGL